MKRQNLTGGILLAALAVFTVACNGDDAPPERIPVPDVASSGGDTRPAGSTGETAGGAAVGAPVALEDVVVQVYKSPTCGCCSSWVCLLYTSPSPRD